MTATNGHGRDVGIERELRAEKPCSARVDGDRGGWCLLAPGHPGSHIGVAGGEMRSSDKPSGEGSVHPNPWAYHKFKMPPIVGRKPDPEDQ